MSATSPAAEREILRRAALRAIGRFHRRWRTTDLTDPVIAPIAIAAQWEQMAMELALIMERLGALAAGQEGP